MGTAVEAGKGSTAAQLRRYYRVLVGALGRQHWWPARTRFEVIVGAILTQNTAWKNVEKAIDHLRRAGLLHPHRMAKVPLRQLEMHVRPAGYFRQKARRLKAFLKFLDTHYQGSLQRMFCAPTETLRAQLLNVPGIGPETADSILLYAGNRPVFVIDAYTRRILSRHGLADGRHDYETLRQLFEHHLPKNPALFNEYHALLVEVGKRWCHRAEPDCAHCPLGPFRARQPR